MAYINENMWPLPVNQNVRHDLGDWGITLCGKKNYTQKLSVLQTSNAMCAFLVLKVCMVKNSCRIGLSTHAHFTIITVVFKIFLQQQLTT